MHGRMYYALAVEEVYHALTREKAPLLGSLVIIPKVYSRVELSFVQLLWHGSPVRLCMGG